MEKPAEKFVLPHLEALLPVDYKKWARPVLIYTIKSAAGTHILLFVFVWYLSSVRCTVAMCTVLHTCAAQCRVTVVLLLMLLIIEVLVYEHLNNIALLDVSAVSVAWTVQRILSAFHSAMRGGLIFSRNILEYLGQMDVIKINHEETMLDEAVGYGLALLGLFFQLSFGFGLPFPLNIILFPFTIMEYILIALVNK